MSPTQSNDTIDPSTVGPHPSYIQIAKAYYSDQNLVECLAVTGVNEAKEDSLRLQGVAWIDSVRKALRLPVRTFNTAVVYYHRFRLVHADNEYSYVDAAAAALFAACKIEDTLKRSKEILCAAYNLKYAASEHLSQDDPMFEGPSKQIVGLERLMLESSAFDFRSHNPQKLLLKIAKYYRADQDTVAKTAYNMSIDLHRTFAPLKQTTSTMAMACVELSSRLHDQRIQDLEAGKGFHQWHTTRAEVMETILDLLDLYTHHRTSSIVGIEHSLDTFISIRITLNQEASTSSLPRFTTATTSDTSPDTEKRRPLTNGTTNGSSKDHKPTKHDSKSPTSPREQDARSLQASNSFGPGRLRAGFREGTVRFMLDGERAIDEKKVVDGYFRVEEEEYEIEVPVSSTRGEKNDRRR